MKKLMKVLIAYDGSVCADAAINDLKHAGLPPEGELLVVTVADIYKTVVPANPITQLKITAKTIGSLIRGNALAP